MNCYQVKISYGIMRITCDNVTALNEQHAKEICAEEIIKRLKLPEKLFQYKLLISQAEVTEIK